MRHPIATPLAFVVALFAVGAEGAQQPPPPTTEHRPPEARPLAARHLRRLERPGTTLDRNVMLRRQNMPRRTAEMILREALMHSGL